MFFQFFNLRVLKTDYNTTMNKETVPRETLDLISTSPLEQNNLNLQNAK